MTISARRTGLDGNHPMISEEITPAERIDGRTTEIATTRKLIAARTLATADQPES